jgi:DNA-binding transcriptional LysR family regulator
MTDQWVGLELRHLATLQAIVETGSFKDAAALLGYTPSAISQQIASLERIIGARVIVREHGRRALGPTEAGKSLLVHMHAIEARLGAAKADIDAFARGSVGTLRIGAFESVERRLLPNVMRRFREMCPDVELNVAETLVDLDLLDAVERGALDLAFAVLPLPDGPFRAQVLLDDPWVLVTRAGDEGELSGLTTLADIGALPLVCWRSPSAIAPVLTWFRAAGIEPNIVLQSDYNEVVQGFAAAGFGVALLPRLALDVQDETTAVVELEGIIPPRQLAIAWHRDRKRSTALESFVSLVAKVASELDARGERVRPFPRAAARTLRAC